MNRIVWCLGLSLAPLLCWAAEPIADQAKAISEIETLLGGNVTVDEKGPGKEAISIDFEYRYSLNRRNQAPVFSRLSTVTDAGLANLKGLTTFVRYLQDTKVTDVGLEYLKGLSKLER